MASRKRPPEDLDESSCHLLVGDEPCTFVQVRDVLYGCASAGKLWPKLLDIATSLEIPTECITSLKRQINTDTITYSGGLLEILLAWRGKFSAEAKLQNLINILERNGLADCADSLRIHFNEFDDAYVVSILQKLKPTAKSSTWEDLPEHLKRWINSKAVIFQGNKPQLEQLTAQIATPVDEKILLELVALSETNTHEVVLLLAEHGADLNAIDKFGRTPLSIANGGQSKVEARTKEYLEMELLLMKWESEIIQHNIDKLGPLTNFESQLLQKLVPKGILLEHDVRELESIETDVSRATKFYTLLLTKKSDFKILLSVFSDSKNTAVLGIFVKEFISFLYNTLMKLDVTVVRNIMNTKGYANVLNPFVQTLEEIDRQPYSDKLSIVQLLCTLNPQVLPPTRPEVYTPLQLAFFSNHEGKLELIQKIIKLNVTQSEIQDFVYLCLADTGYKYSEVDERKRIITSTLQKHPSMYQNLLKHHPLLAPNIHVDLIIHVINLGVDVHVTNESKENLLHLCPKYLTPEEYHRVVNALVDRQETELFHWRNEDQNTPLHVAVENLELLDSTIQLFSSAKVDFNAVDKYNDTALHNAVIFERSERILGSLIKAGADENARGQDNRTVLHYAAGSGNLTALKYFLLRGHDVNVTDEQGSTPLHLVVGLSKTNTHEVVVLLVEHGADVNAINKFGRTPICIANGGQSKVEAQTKEYLESIIKQDAESMSHHNNTQERRCLIICKYICCCDVNAKNIESRTPLHNAFLATKDGKDIMTEHEIVVMLLKEPVNVTAKDTHGKTSIDLAKERLKTGKEKHKTVKVLGKYSSKGDFTMFLKSWLKVKT
ncbi:unnamed protein product [Orchesella dallaii]|uniref:Death domain-containing protein n=1 Tax=Orchesella dallaii TaxID=48710 RepID=A0ABP1RAI0_9HEXA